MKKIVSFIFVFIVISAFGADEKKEDMEYAISPLMSGSSSEESYYNSIGVPNLYIGRQCQEKCEENCCWDVLRDSSGSIKRNYSKSDSVGTVARTRYKNKSYLLFSHTYGPEKDRITKYHLVDNNLKEYAVPEFRAYSLANEITEDRDIVQAFSNGIYVNGREKLAGMSFESAVIGNNIQGDISVAAIENGTRSIYVSDLNSWVFTGINLAQNSDKDDILCTYPLDENNAYIAGYNLINIYNKGLMGAHVNFANSEVDAGWIYNYEKKNIGFYPELYLRKENLQLNAKDATNDKNIHFSLPIETFNKIGEKTPNREGFENESMASFMVGSGVEYLGWTANSSVSDSDSEIDYADTEYEISNSLYKKVYFQGKVSDYQLAISYMKNEAEKVGGLTKQASELMSFFVDFDSLISNSSVLRLAYTNSNINGITTFIDKNNGATKIETGSDVKEFTTDITRLSLLLMKEKGYYWGAEYTQFMTPSAVGFSNSSKNIQYYGLDDEFGIKNIELVMGYDTASYAKRYETDFSKFFFQGLIGGGISMYNMSSAFADKVEQVSGKNIVDSDFSLVFDAEIQMGYIWQQRFKAVKGLGYSIDTGVKVRGIYTTSGQSDDSDTTIESNELTIEMSRYDVWYGPYVNLNIMF